MNIQDISIKDLKPYEKNPRHNDQAVDYVAESIKQFGFKVPIVVDKDNVIVAGHTRYKAAKKLGINVVPCIIADDLTEEQVKAFRLADNKVSEFAEWNFDLLDEELQDIFDIDMSDFGFSDLEEETPDILTDEKYTTKVDVPHYEITGEEPKISELINEDKMLELLEEIKRANITGEQREFLIKAAYRHNVFDYSKIAEYYAHANKKMQELMEKSALVIIDYDDAIKNGYVHLKKEIGEMYEEDDE